MNKQIEHLFNAAGFHKPEMERLGIEHKFEKFAESIVRECANVANQHMEHNEGTDYNVGGKIKQHFGVEE